MGLLCGNLFREYKPPGWIAGLVLAVGLSLSPSIVNAQGSPLYSIVSSSGGGLSAVSFSSTDASPLVIGDSVEVMLPDGTTVTGQLSGEYTEDPHNYDPEVMPEVTSTKVVALGNARAAELHLFEQSIVALTVIDQANTGNFRAIINSEGVGVLTQEDNDHYFCEIPHHGYEEGQIPSFQTENTPSLFTVENLESRPGAAHVIYIDYKGGSLVGTYWNSLLGFSTINYVPFSLDSDTANFSADERELMYQAWLEVADDYAPFNVNVTTKASVYNAHASNKKHRAISTRTSVRDTYDVCGGVNCGGKAGGIGFYGQREASFTFNSTYNTLGQTLSHEVGHTMDLTHDGIPGDTYYNGHGDWGPIMGGPFGKTYVQWSKGEYPNANNQQDDIYDIGKKLGAAVADFEGGTSGTARLIASNSNGNVTFNQNNRLSMPAGTCKSFTTFLGITISCDRAWPSGDWDYYKFSVPTGGGSIDLTVAPRAGVDTTERSGGEPALANLAMYADIYKTPFNSSDGFLEREYPTTTTPLRPNTNKLEHSSDYLAAGDYIIRVENRSPDYSTATGFSDYGNGGFYDIDLDVNVYPFASCGTISGTAHRFSISSNGHAATEREIKISTLSHGNNNVYEALGLNGNEAEHYVTGLPVDGDTLFVQVRSRINGVWRVGNSTCTTATGGEPYIFAPLVGTTVPVGSISSDYDFFYWNNDGASVTNYWLYVGSSKGGRQIFNSDDLGTNTSDYVGPLPDNGKTLYVRLWYKRTGQSWNYKDYEYVAQYDGDDAVLTNPPEGASLGFFQNVYWNPGLVDSVSDRYRVYAGPTYGDNSWTNSGNLLPDDRSYEVDGWSFSDYGSTVWVRFLWRKGGVWKRSNHSYLAGDGPAANFATETEPVASGL